RTCIPTLISIFSTTSSTTSIYSLSLHDAHPISHHIARVMRLKKDDQIICNHPNEQSAICILQNVGPNEVHAIIYRWLERSAELPVQVTIAQGLPKSNKFEFVLQKGTELG